jgi:hypothetical protein
MSKKILAIYYTQTGQLGEIIDSITQPLIESGSIVEKIRLQPETPYPFPWSSKQFFSIMPDCVLDIPTQLKPFILKEKKYDLIILGYQVWFLSPSISVHALLQNPLFKEALKGTRVVTVTGARNMWINAFERIKKILKSTGADLAGNIALVDKHHNFVSLVTIMQWMFNGNKEKYLGIFPKPGVSEEDIKHASVYGKVIQSHLDQNDLDSLQADLVSKKAVEIKYSLMYIENTASRLFLIWARFISKREKKTFWLVLFKYYLLIALFIASPIVLTIDAIFIKPFSSRKIKEKKEYYLGVK